MVVTNVTSGPLITGRECNPRRVTDRPFAGVDSRTHCCPCCPRGGRRGLSELSAHTWVKSFPMWFFFLFTSGNEVTNASQVAERELKVQPICTLASHRGLGGQIAIPFQMNRP